MVEVSEDEIAEASIYFIERARLLQVFGGRTPAA